MNQYSPSNKVIGGQFEADENIAASMQYFIRTEAKTTKIAHCEMTVNETSSIVIDGSRCLVTNTSITGAAGAGEAKLKVNGTLNQISNCLFDGANGDSGASIIDTGGNNFFTGCQVYVGGNVQLGEKSTWTGGGCFDLETTEAYAIVCGPDSTVTGTFVSLSESAGGILAASAAVIVGNVVTDNAGIGIRCQSANATISGNRCSGNTGGDLSFTAYPHGYSPNSNHAGDGVYPLQATLTYDPASLANGASATTNVTVTGAAVGDVASVQFPALASASGVNGLQVTGSVHAANTVKVAITNNSGGTVDLDSGLIVVKVHKQ
jgi:hypothetical protein